MCVRVRTVCVCVKTYKIFYGRLQLRSIEKLLLLKSEKIIFTSLFNSANINNYFTLSKIDYVKIYILLPYTYTYLKIYNNILYLFNDFVIKQTSLNKINPLIEKYNSVTYTNVDFIWKRHLICICMFKTAKII